MSVLSDEYEVRSSPSQASVWREFDAVPHSVRQVRETVAAFAERHGVAGDGVDDIRTAVSEAATNVVMHAYDRSDAGRFAVLAAVDGEQLLVVIDDDGCGLAAASENAGLGIGLRVMEAMAEQARFATRHCGGSTVQLRFRLASAAA